MNPLLLIVLIGAVVGAALGVYVRGASAKQDPIHGGLLAHIFHYLGAVGFSGALPAVLVSIFVFHASLVQTIATAFGFITVSFAALLLYAAFERPARPQQMPVEEGWTAEKARTSGL